MLAQTKQSISVLNLCPGRTSMLNPVEEVSRVPRAAAFEVDRRPDLALAWKDMKKYKSAIRDFVRSGGRYLGFCLGAYVAGHDPGFDLLDSEDDCDQEITQPGSQVHNERDTVIQVDWTFSSGLKDGKTDCRRWLYFQDGAVVKLSSNSTARVLAKYSGDGDVAATVSAFGKGWVGLVGPHPEADQSWCRSWNRSFSRALEHRRTDCEQTKTRKSATQMAFTSTLVMTLSRLPSTLSPSPLRSFSSAYGVCGRVRVVGTSGTCCAYRCICTGIHYPQSCLGSRALSLI